MDAALRWGLQVQHTLGSPPFCPAGYRFTLIHQHLKSVIHWNDLGTPESAASTITVSLQQKQTSQKPPRGRTQQRSRGRSKRAASDLLPTDSWAGLGRQAHMCNNSPAYGRSGKLTPAFVSRVLTWGRNTHRLLGWHLVSYPLAGPARSEPRWDALKVPS